MTDNKFNELLETLNISTEIKVALKEAWEEKTSGLRDEFAQKYEHDKNQIVESLGQMVNDVLEVEANKVMSEKKALTLKNKTLAENMKTFRKFATNVIAEEVKELRADRNAMKNNIKVFENFFVNIAKDEIKELHEDSKKLVETRVKLIKEAKEQLEKTKQQFIKVASQNAANLINECLEEELTVLKEDIKVAHQNTIGQQLFENFAKTFETKFFNENKHINKFKTDLEQINAKLNESNDTIKNLEKKNRLLEDRIRREAIINESIKHLPSKMQDTMKTLVENIQTDKLSIAIKKYMPVVMNDETKYVPSKKLMENKKLTVVTGDKQTVAKQSSEIIEDDELNRIVQLSVNNRY